MAIDREPTTVTYALRMAREYYPQDTYEHVMRVIGYVAENDIIPYEYRDDCVVLAIMHDLIEDTEYTGSGLPENMLKALKLLTKPKELSYVDYIKCIKRRVDTNWGKCAYWVKLADMKDHLSQKETLTEKLKDKYLEALPYLL